MAFAISMLRVSYARNLMILNDACRGVQINTAYAVMQ
jgi:hypothetical protein